MYSRSAIHICTILQLYLILARESGKALVICQFLPFIIHELSESAILLSRDAMAQYKHFNNSVVPFLSPSPSLSHSLFLSVCTTLRSDRAQPILRLHPTICIKQVAIYRLLGIMKVYRKRFCRVRLFCGTITEYSPARCRTECEGTA